MCKCGCVRMSRWWFPASIHPASADPRVTANTAVAGTHSNTLVMAVSQNIFLIKALNKNVFSCTKKIKLKLLHKNSCIDCVTSNSMYTCK